MTGLPNEHGQAPRVPATSSGGAQIRGQDPFDGLSDDGLEATAPMPAVRGWTQAEIDAEIARFGDIPLYEAGAPYEPGAPSDGDPASEDLPDEQGPDGYDWLFLESVASPLSSAVIGHSADSASGPPTEPLQPVPAGPAPAGPAPAGPVLAAVSATRRSRPTRRRRGERIVLATLVLMTCLALGAAGVVFAQGLQGRAPVADGVTAGEIWDGDVAPVDGVVAQADCVAPSGTDGAEQVRYDAANAVDGDPATAWRCDDITTPVIRFTLPADTRVAAVAVVNGYAKNSGGVDQYPLNLRVLTARWTLPDGTVVEQELVDGERSLQNLRVPVTTGGGTFTLQVVKSNSSGTNAVGRGSIVLSEVAFFAPQP